MDSITIENKSCYRLAAIITKKENNIDIVIVDIPITYEWLNSKELPEGMTVLFEEEEDC